MECPICLLRFDGNIATPVLPTCGHAICTRCLLFLMNNTIHPRCPICRNQFGNGDTFPVAFAIITGNELIPNEPDICEKTVCSGIPYHYCQNCESHYCHNCIEKHESHTTTICNGKSMKIKQKFEKANVRLNTLFREKRKLQENVKKLKALISKNYNETQKNISDIYDVILKTIRDDQIKLEIKIQEKFQGVDNRLTEIDSKLESYDQNDKIDLLGSHAHYMEQNIFSYSEEMIEILDGEATKMEGMSAVLKQELQNLDLAIPIAKYSLEQQANISVIFPGVLRRLIKKETVCEVISRE
jgi:hypothetical protein